MDLRKLLSSSTSYTRSPGGNYHEQSQRFIKNSKKQGRNVYVEDGELRRGAVGSYKAPKQFKAPSYKGFKWGAGTGM